MKPSDICELCAKALSLAPPEPSGATQPTEWHSFELKVWELGEDVRHLLKAAPELRANPEVQECLLAVAEKSALLRGRQSFIMNLGFKAAAPHAARIAALLEDQDVAGHALDTLLRMRAAGHASKVWSLTSSKLAWVRKLAKKYLVAYGA